MGGLGMPELLIILLIALVLFGAKRLPEVGRSIGRSIQEFKKGMAGIADDPKLNPPVSKTDEIKG